MSNPLTDVLPEQVRKYAYAVLFVASLVFAAFQAADGDWVQLVGGLIVALYGATAASNSGQPFLKDTQSRPYNETN